MELNRLLSKRSLGFNSLDINNNIFRNGGNRLRNDLGFNSLCLLYLRSLFGNNGFNNRSGSSYLFSSIGGFCGFSSSMPVAGFKFRRTKSEVPIQS